MTPFIENFKKFLERLTLGQKIALATVILGGIGFLTAIAYWAGQPDYSLLFGNLEPADADNVVQSLRNDNIKYELKDGGSAVYVPREDVYELRLRFAGEGLISDGPAGYELFDTGTLGMTDFMQKLNLKRALEGELARTISSVRQVEATRVHLVIPERSPFRESQSEPSASVVLQLSSNGRLTSDQIEGITALVAGAVEGLTPSAVTILDNRSNLLSNPNSSDEEAMISSNQLRIQRATETDLMRKGQSMLDQIVGPGNSLVRVTAELDFNRSTVETKSIDPESQTVVSEERSDGEMGEDVTNHMIRNYQLSTSHEISEKSTGGIRYLTVSVILNSKPIPPAEDAEEDAPTQYETYSEGELQNIEDLVKNTVGFNPDRGDGFSIHQTRFDTTMDDRVATEIQQQQKNEQFQVYIRYGLMVIALALAVWLIRSASQRITEQARRPMLLDGSLDATSLTGVNADGQLTTGKHDLKMMSEEEEEDLVLIDDVYTSKLSPEARKRLKAKHLMFEEIQQQVIGQPSATADLLRNWMLEDQL